jgi:hypothetical protein
MALEAWAHRRIEAGESLEGVLTDVHGPQAHALRTCWWQLIS